MANFPDAIAVTPSETYALVFATGGGGLDIWVYDLVNDVVHTTITNPGPGGNPDGFGAVALADDTFLVPVNKVLDNQVIHYDKDGTTLHTYPIPSPYEDTDFTYITRGLTDATFWCAVDDDTFTHTVVLEFDIATGAILHQWISPAWASGGTVYRTAFAVARGVTPMACPDPCADAGIGDPYWVLLPEGATTYQQLLSALIRTDQVAKVEMLMERWLQEGQVPGPLQLSLSCDDSRVCVSSTAQPVCFPAVFTPKSFDYTFPTDNGTMHVRCALP